MDVTCELKLFIYEDMSFCTELGLDVSPKTYTASFNKSDSDIKWDTSSSGYASNIEKILQVFLPC